MDKSNSSKVTIQYFAGAQVLYSISVPVNHNMTLKGLVQIAKQNAWVQSTTHWRLVINSATSSLQPL